MQGNESRIGYLDTVRGVAILAVIFSHYIPFSINLYQPGNEFMTRLATYGAYGVHLFFIISGYVIYMTISRARSLGHFIFGRFTRLYPAYWFAVTFSFLLIIVFQGHPLNHFQPTLVEYFRNMTMLHRFGLYPSINGVYWSLTFELMFYFYMAIFMIIGLKHHSQLYSVCWLAGTLLFAMYLHSQGLQLSARWKGFLLLEFISYFLTGIALYNYQKNQKSGWFVIIFSLSMLTQYALFDIRRMVVYILLTLLFLACAAFDFPSKMKLAWVGKISYSLYLLHCVPGYFLLTGFYHLGAPIVPSLILTTVLTTLTAACSWKFVEVAGKNTLRTRFEYLLGTSSRQPPVLTEIV